MKAILSIALLAVSVLVAEPQSVPTQEARQSAIETVREALKPHIVPTTYSNPFRSIGSHEIPIESKEPIKERLIKPAPSRQSITLGGKRFYLVGEDEVQETTIDGHTYWILPINP